MFLVVDFSDLLWEIAEFGSLEAFVTSTFELFDGLDAFYFLTFCGPASCLFFDSS